MKLFPGVYWLLGGMNPHIGGSLDSSAGPALRQWKAVVCYPGSSAIWRAAMWEHVVLRDLVHGIHVQQQHSVQCYQLWAPEALEMMKRRDWGSMKLRNTFGTMWWKVFNILSRNWDSIMSLLFPVMTFLFKYNCSYHCVCAFFFTFRIKHENIVALEDIYESPNHLYLVMQLWVPCLMNTERCECQCPNKWMLGACEATKHEDVCRVLRAMIIVIQGTQTPLDLNRLILLLLNPTVGLHATITLGLCGRLSCQGQMLPKDASVGQVWGTLCSHF